MKKTVYRNVKPLSGVDYESDAIGQSVVAPSILLSYFILLVFKVSLSQFNNFVQPSLLFLITEQLLSLSCYTGPILQLLSRASLSY